MPRRWGVELVTIVALVTGGAAVLHYHERYTDAQEVVARTRGSFVRSSVQDRLIGTTIDLARLAGRPESRRSQLVRPSLIWILDLDRCDGCFDTVVDWSELEQLADHDLWLFLTGRSTSDVELRLRVLSRTSIRWLSRDSIAAVLGTLHPNTKLLLSPNGTALMVDSRTSGQECGWNFEAQIGTLRGLEWESRIRPSPTASQKTRS